MECVEVPITSCSSDNPQDDELMELSLVQGINVWGKSQQTLEQQALNELDIFTKDNSTFVEQNFIETTKEKSLDISSYIQRQEELKKIQEYKKTLKVESKSKLIADNITKKYKHSKKRRKKRLEISCTKKFVQEDGRDTCKAQETCNNSSGSEYIPSEVELESDDQSNIQRNVTNESVEKIQDDGNPQYYKSRLAQYYQLLENNRLNDDEIATPDFYTIKGDLKIPISIWSNLFTYQQETVRWMWNLHREASGGILGDEMGLGKTVQLIAFLAGLEYSQVISHNRFKGLGPTLIVCPVTVIHQWVKHFHEWAPEFRVVILHQSGSYQGKKYNLIKDIIKNKGILITSYFGILKYQESLQQYDWHYLILDEGHKIRNPSAKVTLAVKKFHTPHKIMLTGSPMQNNLQELWSLFDFTNHGMLGSLQAFIEHFNDPIVQGGFMNSTPLQEATALSVATTLKSLISPYLLRRSKEEVQSHISLPNKSEQVLFCSLSEHQKELYKGYLMSDHISSIISKTSKNWISDSHSRSRILIGITALRKICNHPDIYLNDADDTINTPDDNLGFYKKSGKMIVVSALLKIWKKQNHRILLFTQSRAMIRIFEKFLTLQDYKFLKMDGSTSVNSRQALINKFNEDPTYDVFLLTTRVGGLGVNLTGANRVIIYDPDWNPATDTQARERAWRIGQEKEVTIYRLLSAGTIEEKMYQRQVWKQLLSNKILIDPKTHKFFKQSNLYDLFSFSEDSAVTESETANIFRDSRVKIQEKLHGKKKQKTEFEFSDDKIEAMKQLAQKIARNFPKPNLYQQERHEKLAEKSKLAKLPVMELLKINREKVMEKPESLSNTVDDSESGFSFEKALDYSKEKAQTYQKIRGDRIKKTKVMKDRKIKVDTSGKIDGEKVRGLVKSEIKKQSKKTLHNERVPEKQDDYVLGKLFSRKGVSGALQHDSVVNNNVRSFGLKLQTEAQLKADKALEALRKSRLKTWRW